MIIACPACDTRYAVPDTAIGSEGRTVRCAKCKHSWFQDPPVLDLVEPQPARTAPAPSPAPQQTERAPVADVAPPPPAPAPVQSPAPQPVPETPADGPSISHWRAPESQPPLPSLAEEDASVAVRALRRGLSQRPAGEDDAATPVQANPPATPPEAEPPFDDEEDDGGSQFDYRAPFTRRRNTLRMWTLAAALFAVLATGTVVAVNYYGLPDWVPISRPTFGIGRPGLEFDFPQSQQRKEALANGEAIFRVRGTITNASRETLSVPNVLVVFSDPRERKVGDWVVVPAKRELAPGETVTVTEAIANIPRGAAVADLGWAPT